MKKDYTNEQLAKDFLSVATPYYSGQLTSITAPFYKIKFANTNISEFYATNQSLPALKVSDKTKHLLELILTIGKDEAEKSIAESRIRGMTLQKEHLQQGKKMSREGRRTFFTPNDSPSFERVVRLYEEVC